MLWLWLAARILMPPPPPPSPITPQLRRSLGVLHWAPVGTPLLDHLMDGAVARRGELTPWMICNIMWGAARLK